MTAVGGRTKEAAAPFGTTAAWTLVPIASIVLSVLVFARVGATGYAGVDFGVYMKAAGDLWAGRDIYAPASAFYVYSPLFAVLVTPLTWLPPEVGLALWRGLGLAAAVLAVRGLGIWGVAAIVTPFVLNDLLVGNVSTFALAAMIVVIRWPSVRTVVAYAVLVAIIPKPQFLPVLLWGVWQVRQSFVPVAIVGALGVAMLAWPGYIDAARVMGGYAAVGPVIFPEPATKILAVVLTVAALRYRFLLGPASVAASAVWWWYTFTPLGLLFVEAGTERPRRTGVLAGGGTPVYPHDS